MTTKTIKDYAVILCLVFPFFASDSADAKSASKSGDPGGHTNKGVQFARKGEYNRAIAEFTKAIEAQPEDSKNYSNRGMAYKLTHQWEQARADFSKVIELNSQSAEGYTGRGEAEMSLNQMNEALTDLDKALTIDPSDTAALRLRAYAYLRKEDWNKAIDDYNKLLERSPNDEQATSDGDSLIAAWGNTRKRSPISRKSIECGPRIRRLIGAALMLIVS